MIPGPGLQSPRNFDKGNLTEEFETLLDASNRAGNLFWMKPGQRCLRQEAGQQLQAASKQGVLLSQVGKGAPESGAKPSSGH